MLFAGSLLHGQKWLVGWLHHHHHRLPTSSSNTGDSALDTHFLRELTSLVVSAVGTWMAVWQWNIIHLHGQVRFQCVVLGFSYNRSRGKIFGHTYMEEEMVVMSALFTCL